MQRNTARAAAKPGVLVGRGNMRWPFQTGGSAREKSVALIRTGQVPRSQKAISSAPAAPGGMSANQADAVGITATAHPRYLLSLGQFHGGNAATIIAHDHIQRGGGGNQNQCRHMISHETRAAPPLSL